METNFGNSLNVYKREHSNTALVNSEKLDALKYRALAQCLEQDVWEYEGDGKNVEFPLVFSWWEKFTGQSLANGDGLYEWADCIHPDDRIAAVQSWRSSTELGSVYGSEYRIKDQLGTWRHVRVRGVPIRDAQGEVSLWVGTFEEMPEQLGLSASNAAFRNQQIDGHSVDVMSSGNKDEVLRQSERRYRAMVSASSDIVYRMSDDWSTMNPLDGRGVVASNDIPIDDWMEKNIPESERARVLEAIEVAISTKQPFQLEHQVNRIDGTIGWTFSRAIPILDEQGKVLEWFGTASDVTRRKVAEEELSDIRSRMEAALNAGAIGTWSWNVVEDKFRGDASFASIFSMNEASLKESSLQRLLDLIHPDDRQRIVAQIQKTLDSGVHYEETYRITNADGGWKWVTARGQVERDESGRPVRFPGVVIDITDWKMAEESLSALTAESEQRKRLYETILSSTPDFIYVFSLEYRILYANESLLKMWGYTWEETIGKTFIDLGYEEWHAEMHCREIDQARETKQPIRGEVPFDGTNGRRVYEYIFVPVIDATGDVVAVAGTTRDVTQRKQLEDALRETDRRKDEFLAMLAHELRNPLVPIRTGLDILSLESTDHQEIIASMNEQMVHIIRLVDDLLDVSRIMQGKVELRKEPVEVSDICKRSIQIVKPTIVAHQHAVRTSLNTEPIWLDADPVRLIQVLGNLLNNSSKYMHPDGLIELSVERISEEVVIRVKDTGIGIEQELLPKVFDLFTQSSRSLDRAQGGLGIGLTLVQRLVNLHNGTVEAHSDGVGFGSTFTIRLPTCQAPSVVPPETVQISQRTTRRIVVVDDNRSATFLISRLLQKLGNHEVAIAHDGESALKKVEELAPEVIFLDIGLPGMDGYEVCRAIREKLICKDALIVALTGYGQEEYRSKSKEVGFDEHLVKPPSVDQIHQILSHPKLRWTV